jgi:uncharacterized repeat protein (TIGR01451 family)
MARSPARECRTPAPARRDGAARARPAGPTGRGARRASGGAAGLLLGLLLSTAAAALPPLKHNDLVVNTVEVTSADVEGPYRSTATVRVRVPSPATIEFFLFAPAVPAATPVPVAPSAYRAGASEADPLAELAPPQPLGYPAPVDLARSVPLVPTPLVHQGEPLFIQVADLDQNLDPRVRETVLVTVTSPTGDVEVLRLTETGPDTGVFVAYIPTAGTPTGVPYGGVLEVMAGQTLTTRYRDPDDTEDTALDAVLVDPFGVVFDSRTGARVDGAVVTLVDVATGLPADVFGDDGVSAFPSVLTSGGEATDAGGRRYDFAPGEFRFPLVRPGTYRLEVRPPEGYAWPSTAADADLAPLPGGPFTVAAGSRGEPFVVLAGPPVRADQPVDPASTSLWVRKTAGKELVSAGDFVPYDVTVTNLSATAAARETAMVDRLPVGLRYVAGSAQRDGAPLPDPEVGADGRSLTFRLGELAPRASTTVRLLAQVAAGARVGARVVNVATAGTPLGASSNEASASVLVQDAFLSARALIAGRITTGACGTGAVDGAGRSGVAGVRLLLEDGTYVVSDAQGLFHFENVRPGTHVVQLDLSSLPEGYEPLSCPPHSRFAGRSFSQFVDVQGGSLWRADFHVRPRHAQAFPALAPVLVVPEPEPAAPAVAEPLRSTPQSGLQVRMRTQVDSAWLQHEVTLEAKGVALKDVRVALSAQDTLTLEEGSSRLDAQPLAEPDAAEGGGRVYRLGDVPAGWSGKVTFRSRLAPNPTPGAAALEISVSARDLDSGRALEAYPPLVRVQVLEKVSREPLSIVVRPKFDSGKADLLSGDQASLDAAVAKLQDVQIERLKVVGHTDNQRINPRTKGPFKTNGELSLGRAGTVARYLAERLGLPADQVLMEGEGERSPVADNRTAAGRAQNRRVELEVFGSRQVKTTSFAPSEAAAATPGAAPQEEPATFAPLAVTTTPQPGAAGAPAPEEAPAPVVAPPPAPAAAADGILSPAEGEVLVERTHAVRTRLRTSLKPQLLVDGVEVPSERVGFTSEDPASGQTERMYIGVDLGDTGPHTLTFRGLDPFGNARFEQALRVVRAGRVAGLRFVEADKGNVADGKTPVRLRFELLDAKNEVIRAAARLDVREGTLAPPLRRDGDNNVSLEAADRRKWVEIDRDGWVAFAPVDVSGSHHAVLATGTAWARGDTYAKPQMRDWVLVGLAEGGVGYNVVSGNMESLAAGQVAEDLYQDGRIALYAKGQIKGEWLLTLAFDSAKDRREVGNSLFQVVDPNAFYTLYGDATQQGYDAASARKLYVKVEREQFYALFGDYDTGLTVTELTRYSRRMNGVKSELQLQHAELNVFGAQTDLVYTRDELRGDGTSGLYRLSRGGLTLNAEKVTLQVRDRFRTEVVLSSRTLARFLDYTIDYEQGTLFFREPVFSRDAAFNPVFIVVEYETPSATGQAFTAGGRAGLKLLGDRLKVGATFLHEGQGTRSGMLYGADARFDLAEGTQLHAELAASDVRASAPPADGAPATDRAGLAYVAELLHRSGALDARAYVREQQAGFGLGQQALTESGTRKLGADGAWRFSELLQLQASAFRQYALAAEAHRDMAEGRLAWGDARNAVSAGLRYANDTLPDGTSRASTQATAGGRLTTLGDRLLLTGEHAQSLFRNENADFPTRSLLGAELKVTDAVALLAAQEFTWGAGASTSGTRLGLRSQPWEGATVSSSMEGQLRESGARVFGNMGLRQAWKVSESLRLDAGLERTQTVHRAGDYLLNPGVPAASGASEDFTALSAGASHTLHKLLVDYRLETRLSETQLRVGVIGGAVAELSQAWGWSARLQYLQGEDFGTGVRSQNANARLGFVYRPVGGRWMVLSRLDGIMDRQEGGPAVLDTARLVENLTVNFQPAQGLQLSVHGGLKLVRETVAGAVYQSLADVAGIEGRYDLTPRWDLGLRASMHHTWKGGGLAFSAGPSVGYNVATNMWVSAGWNVWGYDDADFAAANYAAQGPNLRFRVKFDQQTVQDAARWVSHQ